MILYGCNCLRCDVICPIFSSPLYLFCSLHFVCPPSPMMIVVCAVSHGECDGRWDIMDGTCWALMSWPKIAAASEHYGNWFFTVVVVAVYLSTSPQLRVASRFHFFGGEKQINHSRSVCQCKYLCMHERERVTISLWKFITIRLMQAPSIHPHLQKAAATTALFWFS